MPLRSRSLLQRRPASASLAHPLPGSPPSLPSLVLYYLIAVKISSSLLFKLFILFSLPNVKQNKNILLAYSPVCLPPLLAIFILLYFVIIVAIEMHLAQKTKCAA